VTTSTPTPETEIEAVKDLPIVRIVREFDAPPAKVFRAHTDPELLRQWSGPATDEMRIDDWDCRTGGTYAYSHMTEQGEFAVRGCFHDVVPSVVIVQTFGFPGQPESAVLERYTFDDLGDGRTRLTVSTLAESFETRDAIIASGMEHGVREGYRRLDELLGTL
jgi:uncharacterized protein YndB with AHSA1/START domain